MNNFGAGLIASHSWLAFFEGPRGILWGCGWLVDGVVEVFLASLIQSEEPFKGLGIRMDDPAISGE